MTVAELIKRLRDMDPNALVVFDPGPQYQSIQTVVPISNLDYVEIELNSNKFEIYRIVPGAAVTAVMIG